MARGKILVVDDSDTERALMTTSLQRDGYTVITANNGEDALAQLEQQTPDLMLLDVVMPGINGYQLCRSLRRNPRFAKLPIVLVTSKDQDTDRAWGLKQGATEYITKPFSPTDLLATVRRHA